MNQHVVIGTAGHVDHGKSRLVEALTGVHPDRLDEERRRGITIDLGFAALELPGFGRAGLVDVPGHERFVRTMVAGAAGIDIMLLVVAMDEGVMPQTREHLDVCRLLGVGRGVVALTKADLLETLGDDWEPLVRADLEETLAGTFLEGAPVVTVSADDGSGLDDLLESLATVAEDAIGRDQSGPLFLPVDRAFTMRGFGTVVTGTLLSGAVDLGDEISIAPGGPQEPSRVRGLQVHGAEVERAGAGQRTAINLAAVSKGRIDRGSVLVSPGAPVSGRVMDARLEVLEAYDRPIRQRSRMQVHIGTGQAEATMVLLEGKEAVSGETHLVQIHLDRALSALPGQPFILRGSRVQSGRGRTIAGGRILGLAGKRRRPNRKDALRGMEDLASNDPARQVEAVVELRGLTPIKESSLPYLTGLPRPPLRKAVELLISKMSLVIANSDRRLLLHSRAAALLEREALALIEAHHEAEPLSSGLSREALRSSLPGPPPPRLFNSVLSSLAAKESVQIEDDRVRLPEQGSDIPEQETETAERIRSILEESGLSPPRLKQIADELSLDGDHVHKVAARLVEQGELERVKDDLYFSSAAVGELEESLTAWLDEHGEIDTQGFKQLTGVTRRHAIPLSEYFDRKHLTLRVGDKRVRRGRSTAAAKGAAK